MNYLIMVALLGGITFYTWIDEYGVKHVSNVPEECIENGTVKFECQNQLPVANVKEPVKQTNELAITGVVVSVIDEGILISDVRITKNIDAVYELKKDGGIITHMSAFTPVEFNAFVITKGDISYYDRALFRGVVKPDGRFQYTTAIGAAAVVPQYISIFEFK